MKFNNSKEKSKYFWGSTFVIILATLLVLYCGNASEENADNTTIAKSASDELPSVDKVLVDNNTFSCSAPAVKDKTLLQYCQRDSDCVAVLKGSCNCNNGAYGQGINKAYKVDWERVKMQQLAGLGTTIQKICICRAVGSCDPQKMSSKCVNNQCTFEDGLPQLNLFIVP